ncbi:sensor histidine kinase [Flavobacterium sp. SM2513]|uniref:sensor histidine kinase n=1 Tax=Flavobacterium sp. SM2513 TaxID=3424766 RepID=UPI003D7F69B5
MYFNKVTYSWIFSFLLSTVTFAQGSDKIIWTSDTDLLPQNSVKSIVPDKYGYLWLSTENGLVRYDGKNYKIYNSQNLNLKSNRTLFIQGNPISDSLFVATDFSQDLVLIHNREAIKVDSSKIPNSKTYLNTDGKFHNAVGAFAVDLDEYEYKVSLPSLKYYIITKNEIKYYSSKNKLLASTPFINAEAKNFFSIGEKLFYLKNAEHFAVFTEGKIKWNYLNNVFSTDFQLIWNKASNQVFIISDNLLSRIKFQNEKLTLEVIIKNEQIKLKSIIAVYYDENIQTLFLGSSTSGLGIHKKQKFKTISYFDDKHSSVFYAIESFSDKTILSASGFVMNKDTIVHNYNFITRDKTIMHLDQNKNLWLKSHNNLYYYSKADEYKKFKTYTFSEKTQTIFQENPDKIWVVLVKGIENRSRLVYFKPNQNPTFKTYCSLDFRVNYMQKSLDGKIWLAGSKGLYELDYGLNILKHIKGTGNLDIRSVLQTGQNEVWICTYESGFYVYKDGVLHKFPLDKNGYLSTTHYIMEDTNGFFWITTNKGLFQVKKEALRSYIKNPDKSIYYHYYNKESGFFTNEFNGGSSPFSAKLGTQFFLPSMNGVVTFDTKKIKPLEPNNPIYIDEIKVDDKAIGVSNSFNLPNNYQRVTFSFSSPYFGNPFNTNFEAKLEGPTGLGWTPLSVENKYSFTKLSPGSYTLTVRKLSGFDSEYTYKKVKIEIAPLFYETRWFILLMVLLGALLIYTAIKVYSNNVRRRNKILIRKIAEKTKDLQDTIGTLRTTKDNMKKQADKNNKLIQIISHDIKSPLKFMSMASKYMYDDFDPNSPDLKENILAIYTSSSQIYNFLDNVLSYSKVNSADGELENDHFLLCEEIQHKIRFFKNIANAEKTHLNNLIPKEFLLHTNRSLFAIIIHNLLDNALKHTNMTVIEFSAKKEEDNVFITIKDGGKGMNLETLHYYQSVISDFDLNKNKSNKKLGFHLVIELMLILNGKIELQSTEGKGTIITLQFSNQTEKESS